MHSMHDGVSARARYSPAFPGKAICRDWAPQSMSRTPEQFRQAMQAEIEKWGKVIKDAGIKFE